MHAQQEKDLSEVAWLPRWHAADPTLLSLFLTVPLDPARLRELPPRLEELAAAAAGGHRDGGSGRLRDADRRALRDAARAAGPRWLGASMAIFACADLDLLEVMRLRCQVPERAVLAARPHIRPLLAARQWCPDYRIAMVDTRHAWLFTVAGEEIATTTAPVGESARGREPGGWYGLETHRVHQRVIQLARQPYRDTALLLEESLRDSGPQPLVIAGHEEGIRQFFSFLPAAIRKDFAGSFAVDPHSVTKDRIRALAQPVIRHWSEVTARQVAAGIALTPPGGPAAVGLPPCLAAVNAHTVTHLVLPGDGLVPGYACERCGQLSVTASCPVHGAHGQPVPDLFDEMARGTVDDGGAVTAVRAGVPQVAARLRLPPPHP